MTLFSVQTQVSRGVSSPTLAHLLPGRSRFSTHKHHPGRLAAPGNGVEPPAEDGTEAVHRLAGGVTGAGGLTILYSKFVSKYTGDVLYSSTGIKLDADRKKCLFWPALRSSVTVDVLHSQWLLDQLSFHITKVTSREQVGLLPGFAF
ncbi:hypothetical protein VTK56DRAFT_1589 [Thermocarpiscus australiensis]